MAFFLNASVSQSTTEESDVFESQIIDGNEGVKILPLHRESRFHRATSRFYLPPMSAPPTVNRSFQFGVDSSHEEKSNNMSVASGNHTFGGRDHIPSMKTRAKSLSFVQPACRFSKQYQERMATNGCCLTANTLSIWKWGIQSPLYGQSNEGIPCITLCSEQPENPYSLGTGVSIQIVNAVDVSMMSCGPLVNVASSPIIDMLNVSEREYSPGRICRICHDSAAALISPCLCAGTVALIHKDCLERWLTQINRSSCEICKFEYRVERKPLPFYKIFRDSTNNKLRRSILTDMACFVGLTPLAIAAICLCLLGAMQVFQTQSTDDSVKLEPAVAKAQEASRQWEAGWLIFLAVMLLLVYIIWFSCTFNSHMKTWAQWRLASLQVKLLDVKRPCLDQVGASDNVPLAPIRLMMDDATVTPSDESTLNIPVADSPARAQLPGSATPDAVLVDLPAEVVPGINRIPVNGNPCDRLVQDVPRINSTSVNGAGLVFSNTGEIAEVDGNCDAVPINLLRW